MSYDGWLRRHRVLICDRDGEWSAATRQIMEDAGIHVVQSPYRAPNANADAERFVRSINEECLDRIFPIGERHFRRSVADYVAHHHHERNHQGLGNVLIERVDEPQTGGRILCRPRLGGLLKYYTRAA